MNKKEKQNIRLFSIGMFISVFGSNIYTFAIGLYVLKLTNSGLNFAINLLSGVFAALIFSPIGGVISDRLDKKKLIIIMDLLNGLMFLALFLRSDFRGLHLGMIYLSTFLTTGLTQIFGVSFDAAKPQMVTPEKLLNVNGIDKIINSAATIIGPAIGGIIFAVVNIKVFILVNAISFISSAILECFIEFTFDKKDYTMPTDQPISFKKDFKEGMDYIKMNHPLKIMIFLFTAINFFISLSISVPMPYIINEVLKLESHQYGMIQSFLAIGMITGAVTIPRVMNHLKQNIILKGASMILSILIIAMGLPFLFSLNASGNLVNYFYVSYYSLMFFIFGVIITYIDIPVIYYMQTSIPSELRGRVMSTGIAGGKLIAPIGLILAGLLLNHIQAFILPLLGGSILLTSLIFCLIRNQ